MNILWVSNIIFPEVCSHIGKPIPFGGGWMYSAATSLFDVSSDIHLGVISFYDGDEVKKISKFKIVYYLIPKKLINSTSWKFAISDFKPDIIHIHGTEYKHSLSCVNNRQSVPLVVSIQGLVSCISSYYYGNISINEIIKDMTLRDLIRMDSLIQRRKELTLRGKLEVELLKKVENVIGRTSWDYSNVMSINPSLNYYSCNESLRDAFYHSRWNLNNCIKNTIFLSQAHYPLKGLQQVLKALPIVLQKFPSTELYIAGNDFIHKPFFRREGYSVYIQKLITKFGLQKKVHFLGILSEKEMVEQYCKAHVFICPSAIENSSNSIGEAQLVGTPCVASYVGGSMDMIEDEKTGLLYRYEEYTMLAHKICRLFTDYKFCQVLSQNEHFIATTRHNRENNAKNLYSIYQNILKS